jgi:diguanylate cyclase (GGDEF)-like protein
VTKVEVTKILLATPKAAATSAGQDACLVHIYPTGPAIGSRFPLPGGALVVGRDEECDICIEDESVSRRHASLQPHGSDYYIIDLQSTNGTFVNERRVTAQKLKDGDYLHIGNCIYRFLAGGNIEASYHEEIHRLTIVDALTDVFNRRYLLEHLAQELTAAGRNGRCLSLAMFDVDWFKWINDNLGHLVGDFTLREMAAVAKNGVRQTDVLARYGGEEFAVVMADTGREQALAGAERLRQAVAVHPFSHYGKSFPVTVSIGVATFNGNNFATTRELIAAADANLLKAKEAGRNRVVG